MYAAVGGLIAVEYVSLVDPDPGIVIEVMHYPLDRVLSRNTMNEGAQAGTDQVSLRVVQTDNQVSG